MTLHIDSSGSGSPLVMLHGWGMHGGIWGSVAATLAQHYRVHCVDLPGHGYSASRTQSEMNAENKFTLNSIVDELSVKFDDPVTVCGWSLGGQVALHWARIKPQQVNRLVLVATTPCFVRQPDWDYALRAEALQSFAATLQENYELTLRRFLTLQVRGSEREREMLADFRGHLFSRGEPDISALIGGLAILRDTDLRAVLPQITQPALVLAGERDTLTPPAASAYLAETLADARLAEITGAAHTPFLSHPDIFVNHLMRFMHERI